MVGDMVDVVADLAAKLHLELRPVITLVEPRLLDRPGFSKAPYYVRMVEAADILVANRCDLATADQRTRFKQWAAELWPPKLRVLETTHGELPDELFDLNSDSWQITRPSGQRAGHSEQAFSGGCRFPATQVFDAERVEQAIQQLAMHGLDGHAILRLKTILHTTEGWKLYEIAGGRQFYRPTDYRHENLLDWIAATEIPQQAVQTLIAQCLVAGLT
jgi:G3E family GTPase